MSNTTNPNTQLVSLPNSLQAQLTRAQNLLEQSEVSEARGNKSLAVVQAKEGLKVLRELARTSPELAFMGMLAQSGYTSVTVENYERKDSYQVVERKFLGMTIATDVVNLPTITRSSRTVRIS